MTQTVHVLEGPNQSPPQLVEKLSHVLFELEDDHRAVIEYGALLTALTATEEMEGDVARGMNRLAWQIIDHGKKLEAAHGEMTGIVRRLRNP